ncbi:MAG TPA: Lrp/AsnC family transcriptional regulator [Micromonosporaceae bacterium]
MDQVDRRLLAALQEDATQSYAALAAAAGLSTAATHDRVRKLRERGAIRRTSIDVDPRAVGYPVLAFVLVGSDAWIGGPATAVALRALPWVQEAHIVAGASSLLLKVRAASTEELQSVLRRIYDIDGVASTETVVVLETFFERPVHLDTGATEGKGADGA